MISVSGIRGLINDSFSEELIRRWTNAFGRFCLEKNAEKIASVVIGRDTRQSGEWTEKIITEELIMLGIRPILTGIVPTPTVELAVTHHQANGGIIITASHNPIEWNGLKFLGADGVFLDAAEVEKLKQLVKDAPPRTLPQQKMDVAAIKDANAITRHIEKVLSTLPIDLEKIRAKKFKVVLDPVNGAGALAVPLLLDKLGCVSTIIYGEPSGVFGHTPEPRPENLTDLSEKVREVGAVIGFAVDPDADRLALINEKGEAISEENTLVLATLGVFKSTRRQQNEKSQTIAVNLSTSRMIDDVAKLFAAKVIRSAVGERNVIEEMRKNNSIVGGEGNGGVIFPSCHEGRDSLVGIALILDLLTKNNESVSDILNQLPGYIMEKIKIPVPSNFNPVEFGDSIKKFFPEAIINNIDGIRVDTEEGWVHVRASNTEPIFRIIAEVQTKQSLEKLITKTKQLLS